MVSRVAIIGASGAIGSAFVEYYAEQRETQAVFALSRWENRFSSSMVTPIQLDLASEDSIARAAEHIRCPLDIIIVASGLLHDKTLKPEKSLQQLTQDHLQTILRINTIGPALVMKYFLPLLARDRQSVFAALSARVGSISDNRLGGWYSYRASKAALNMLLKTAAIEMGRRNRQAKVVGLHPGTVDSALSEPFQQRVPSGKLFVATYAAEQMAAVLASLPADASGKCFAYDGSVIPP
jgi:NAD(P)-dependent dehydrogenase (short-subunit alcohol dehydrogenase family)